MPKIVCFFTKSEPLEVIRKGAELAGDRGTDPIQTIIYEVGALDADDEKLRNAIEETKKADLVLFYIHGTVTSFKGFPKILPLLGNTKMYFHSGMEEECKELSDRMGLYPSQYRTISRYYNNAEPKDLADMFCYMAQEVLEAGLYPHDPPSVPKPHGLYGCGREDEAAFLEEAAHETAPVVGILVHRHNYSDHNMMHVDALIQGLRKAGAVVICAYSEIVPDEETGFGGVAETMRRYFTWQGKPVIGCLLNLTCFSVSVLANPGNGDGACEHSIFELLDVPVLQVMTTSYDHEEWDRAPAGLHPATLTYSVFQPEFDGQLITYPVAYTHKQMVDGVARDVSLPIEERVDSLCRLAVNWAKLTRIPMEEKRIAVILHNIPPRNDTIGCASGLDTPASIFQMIEDWRKKGLSLEYRFQDGQEIIQKIIDGVTNDGRWSSEAELLEKSVDTVKAETYQDWYDGFSDRVHQQMEKDWGPAPGTYMTVDRQLLIPGILNGSLFIGLQPPRALMEKAEELLHNTDIVCPHQYIAFYRWISDVFGAHAVVHVGTHGTLEWLPGKEVGLSQHCYPDLAIHTLPNLYPYIISNPGEGTQAKRRSYCAVVDHLIPSFVESGVYDELAELDTMLKEYYHFALVDRARTEGIARRIWETAKEHDLDTDLELTDQEALADLDGTMDKIHTWVSRIQGHEIKDGLHIYGVVPQGYRLRNLIKVLVRVKNGDVPSLRQGLCAAAGLDLDELLAHPANRLPDGTTNAMKLESLDEEGRKLFEAWEADGYPSDVEKVIRDSLSFTPVDIGPLEEVMSFASKEVKPHIEQTERELTSLTGGLCGRMVPPGPSGNPTRGNARLLPTGANFYSVDPAAIPTRSAWETGVTLGKQLLERYEREEGRLPENITMLVYATEAMRTTGDDIAEILWLLGLRPVWLGGSDRVIGFEPFTTKELGRPRIDVTLRITGLFRDTFPNLIERIEDAVNFVAALDESHEENYIKKHVDEELQELCRRGIGQEEAFERASVRIYGDPPGTYGAGVKELVYAKKWETQEDLGRVFTAWGCHAYGKKLHGEKRYEDFARRLSKTDVSVRNESNIESDMLASDDFYNYFGGLVGAVATHSGEMRPSFIPSTADKEHLELFSLHEEASKIMRARVNNPKWIQGLKEHGYKGAQEVSMMVDIVFGWDATTHVIDDWMYSAIAKRYAFDQENAEWIRSVNIYAMQNIAERLLEAVSRGMWNASEEEVEQLRSIYMEMEGDIEGLHD